MQKILSLILLPIIINNNLVNNYLTNYLTNLYLNNLLLLLIFLLTINIKKVCINNVLFSLFLINSTLSSGINVPLSNTLFLPHPLIIYLCLIFIIGSLTNNLRLFLSKYFYLLNITMWLGGYWSLQEFNWGGWWNWDMLECYIAFISYFVVFLLHKYKKPLFYKNKLSIILFITIIYYFLLNKLGLNISIHSFIKSNFYNNFFIVYFLLTYLILFFFNFNTLLYFVITLPFINILLNNLFVLKTLLILIVFFKLKRLNKLIIQFTHKIWYYLYMYLLLFNFKNITYYSFFKAYVKLSYLTAQYIYMSKFLLYNYFCVSQLKTNFFWFKLGNYYNKFLLFFVKLGSNDIFFSFFF